MKFVSWNVNGLRSIISKNFYDAFAQLDADIFALQEIKCQEDQVEVELPGYYQYFSYAEKKGYSGTAVFSKQEPMRVLHGLGQEYLDQEGRICALEFERFWFVDVYTPNAQPGLVRINHRMQWDDAFRDFCINLQNGQLPNGEKTSPKPVVMCGDFNVARLEIDLKNPKANKGNAGFSDEERGKINELIDAGFIDTFRYFYPDLEGKYSWWSYQRRARLTNAGWRIDYFYVSNSLQDKLESACIYDEIQGSDHCPVGLTLDI